MFIVGIDVAKRSHEVCMITSDGQTVQRPFSIRNNCTGYNLMLEKIRKHTNIKSQIVFAMESTAHYWLALFTRLRKDGYHVILLNPIQTSAMRDMFIRKIKTDAKDSFIIADHLMPTQIRIANLIARSPDHMEMTERAERASIKDGQIVIEPIER